MDDENEDKGNMIKDFTGMNIDIENGDGQQIQTTQIPDTWGD